MPPIRGEDSVANRVIRRPFGPRSRRTSCAWRRACVGGRPVSAGLYPSAYAGTIHGMTSTESRACVWVLETEIFSDGHERLAEAVRASGGEVVRFRDDWLVDDSWPALRGRPVVFHGSLGNAAVVNGRTGWRPGAFCDVEAFRCSSWYPRAAPWLLNRTWVSSTVAELSNRTDEVLAALGSPSRVFVRPDSPLKPFSGRVVAREAISPKALDHRFYYDDLDLPILVAPVREVGREWRFVIVEGRVVAGSAYDADTRSALPDDPEGEARRHAQRIASELSPPEDVYVMDIGESGGELRLVELNPWSGADLYACDRAAVVEAVSELVRRTSRGGSG